MSNISGITSSGMNTDYSTSSSSSSSTRSSRLVPALGVLWSHSVTHRVCLTWTQHVRRAILTKSPTLPYRECYYTIDGRGVRDFVMEESMGGRDGKRDTGSVYVDETEGFKRMRQAN